MDDYIWLEPEHTFPFFIFIPSFSLLTSFLPSLPHCTFLPSSHPPFLCKSFLPPPINALSFHLSSTSPSPHHLPLIHYYMYGLPSSLHCSSLPGPPGIWISLRKYGVCKEAGGERCGVHWSWDACHPRHG